MSLRSDGERAAVRRSLAIRVVSHDKAQGLRLRELSADSLCVISSTSVVSIAVLPTGIATPRQDRSWTIVSRKEVLPISWGTAFTNRPAGFTIWDRL